MVEEPTVTVAVVEEPTVTVAAIEPAPAVPEERKLMQQNSLPVRGALLTRGVRLEGRWLLITVEEVDSDTLSLFGFDPLDASHYSTVATAADWASGGFGPLASLKEGASERRPPLMNETKTRGGRLFLVSTREA